MSRLADCGGMVILGAVLLIVGFLLGIPVVWWIGAILLAIGLILLLAGGLGHPVAGRRWYY